jgi:hypothetical protein
VTVFSWWYFLCAVGALNIAAWTLSAVMLSRRRQGMSEDSYVACRRQVVLAAVYVFGCAFRSVLPVFDIPRLCLFDTWLSSAFVGRSVATLAELCFVAQWALLLRDAALLTKSRFLKVVSHLILPLIAVAEVCSWYSVLTTSNVGHIIEESLWGLSATLVAISLAAFEPRCPKSWRPALIAAVTLGSAYAAYMFLVDVPMYWSRWMADLASGRSYLTIAQGAADMFERRVVSHRWEDWRGEMLWMSLYFSVAVWISISLIHMLLRRMGSTTVIPAKAGTQKHAPPACS